LIVGANGEDPAGFLKRGSAYVYSGIDGTLIYQWTGEVPGDQFGYAVSGAGDVNGDGIADLIVGALNADPGGRAGAGSVYVYSGADFSVLFRLNGERNHDEFGISVAGAGDVNGDGFDDLIFGAMRNDPGGRIDAGAAYVRSGGMNGPLIDIRKLDAGSLAVVDVTNCTPNKNVYIAWSFAGGGPINTPFGPGYVTPPLKVMKLRMGAFGNATITQSIPLGLSGTYVWFHGVDINSGVMLNPLALCIQ